MSERRYIERPINLKQANVSKTLSSLLICMLNCMFLTFFERLIISWDRVYSVSHKVEMSERFKSHSLEFKGQSSNLKHVEKIDECSLNEKNVDI